MEYRDKLEEVGEFPNRWVSRVSASSARYGGFPSPLIVSPPRGGEFAGEDSSGKGEGESERRLKGGFGIWTSVVTLELFRDLHALGKPVFGYVEDEGIVGKEKCLVL